MVHHSKHRNSKGGVAEDWQRKCYVENTGLAVQRRKVQLGFGLRRVGWAEGGAEGGAGGV